MKRIFFTVLLGLNLILFSTTFVFSQDNAEERLNQIEAKIATKGANTATQASKARNQKTISFVEGSVVANSGSILTVSSEGNTKTIYTTDSTKFINIDSTEKKLIGFGDIKVNDTILVVGVPQVSSVGTAKLIIRDQNKIVKAFSMIGKISELKDNLLVLSHFSRTDLPNQNISLTSETAITAAKNKILDRTSLVTGQLAIVSGIIDDKGSFLVRQIFLTNYKDIKATSSAKQ